MKDRFHKLTLYFNQFADICNDTVLLPKEQKVKGGKIKEAPANIPPDVLFPKSSSGLTRKKDQEYKIHRDSRGDVIVDPTVFISQAPITLDFSEFAKEYKL